MRLCLKVLHIGDEPVDDLSAVILSPRGSIGRAVDNDLVLPDNDGVISRKHAKIEIDGQRAFITDCSVNGTLLLEPVAGDSEDALNEVYLHRETSELANNSYLIVGNFEIHVQFVEESAENVDCVESGTLDINTVTKPKQDSNYRSQPAHFSALNDHFVVAEVENINPSPDEALIPEELNIDDFFADGTDSTAQQGMSNAEDIFASLQDPAVEEAVESVIQDTSAAPVKIEQFEGDDFPAKNQPILGSLADDGSEKTEIILPTIAENNIQDNLASQPLSVPYNNLDNAAEDRLPVIDDTQPNAPLDAFFQGLGIEPGKRPDNAAELEKLLSSAGKILKNLLETQVSLLKARSDLKKEFSASMTMIQREENNPLKFCQSTEELIEYLFVNTPPGFLSAEQAVDESIQDLCCHQIAMMAGIQAALRCLLNKFSPDVVEKNCDAGLFNKSSKYWDYYVDHYSQIAQIAQVDFLGRDFAKAYESQVETMKQRNGIKSNGTKK